MTIERRQASVARGVATAHPIEVVRAEGARVWDANGKEYLDFIGGIGVVNVGHNHPRVVRAMRLQLERFTHVCFQVATYAPYVELAERLDALVSGARSQPLPSSRASSSQPLSSSRGAFSQPLPSPSSSRAAYKTLLLTTGAEAVENAVKIARAYTNRPAVIAFDGGFHGRTLLGMTLTATGSLYRQNFGPFAPEVYHAPFPHALHGVSTEAALRALEHLFATRVPRDRVAAFLVEPQLGEGGFVPAPPEFLKELRRLATAYGIVLVLDEIQTGFGRTGRMFAFQHFGIEPDLMTLAKSLGGGLPLSAVVGKAEIMDAPAPGGLGGTYSGNPLACAAALAVLDVFEEEGLLERSQALGAQLHAGLTGLQSRFPRVAEVRGLGCMLAIELSSEGESAVELTQRILDEARARGLLLLRCGPHKNAIRFLPPLNAMRDDIDRALAILEGAFQASLSA
ncbi:aspartate aminotransferase family protein [Pendulispora albinea]|uniref:Aspartate aminotransferase family protein n=1 Tax=Pendulispora albinea TaxID=2741071 RepID=A0ABZ2LUJ7_9BACT